MPRSAQAFERKSGVERDDSHQGSVLRCGQARAGVAFSARPAEEQQIDRGRLGFNRKQSTSRPPLRPPTHLSSVAWDSSAQVTVGSDLGGPYPSVPGGLSATLGWRPRSPMPFTPRAKECVLARAPSIT